LEKIMMFFWKKKVKEEKKKIRKGVKIEKSLNLL